MSVFTHQPAQSLHQHFRAFAIVMGIIFVCAMIGILGRPLFFLAIFWPANAVLLGLFLRFPSLRNAGGWLGAFAGFMAADLIMHNYFILTLFLTISNMLHAACSLALLQFFKLDFRQYNKGLTFLFLFLISAFGGCLAAAGFASLTVPHLPNTFMTMERIWTDFGMWWTGEILNVIAFLPILLAIPDQQTFKNYWQDQKLRPIQIKAFMPLFAIIGSVILTHFLLVQGPSCSRLPH